MKQEQLLFFKLEIIWWILTLSITIGILYPIYSKIANAYPFYQSNILFIITFITLTRLIFLLKYSFLAYWEKVKIAIILLSAVFIFLLVNELNFFQTYLDERGFSSFLNGLTNLEKASLTKYIRSEMLLFGIGSIIAAIILPFRLLLSIWRIRNRGKI